MRLRRNRGTCHLFRVKNTFVFEALISSRQAKSPEPFGKIKAARAIAIASRECADSQGTCQSGSDPLDIGNGTQPLRRKESAGG